MAWATRRTAPVPTVLNDLDRGEAEVDAAVAVEDNLVQRIAQLRLHERRKQHVDHCTSRSLVAGLRSLQARDHMRSDEERALCGDNICLTRITRYR